MALHSKIARKLTPVRGKTGAGHVTDCIGCRSCEVACSWSKEGSVRPALSRIRIQTRELEWIEKKVNKIVQQRICRQCEGMPPCMTVCPIGGAMYRHPDTEAVIIDDEKCVRCKKCIQRCPFGAIFFSVTANRILKCDLCGGHPNCVEWCPVGALEW